MFKMSVFLQKVASMLWQLPRLCVSLYFQVFKSVGFGSCDNRIIRVGPGVCSCVQDAWGIGKHIQEAERRVNIC